MNDSKMRDQLFTCSIVPKISALVRPAFCIASVLLAVLMPSTAVAKKDGFAVAGEEWPGYWFTCEFARSQSPPDDKCEMFDDEGFQLAEGRLRYIRMIGSTETECRGNKKGQCFSSSTINPHLSNRPG